MGQITRKYDFQAGARIQSSQVDEEFDQLVEAHNYNDDRLVNAESSIANTLATKQELTNHTAVTAAHGATYTADPSRIMIRDAAGRAKVASPAASDDIARKDTVDVVQTNLNDHKQSADHDGRYFTKTQLGSVTPGASGADNIGSAPIVGLAGYTIRDQVADMKSQITGMVIGQIPDGSITPAKLSFVPSTPSDFVRQPGYAADTGAANVYVLTLNPAPAAYVEGMAVAVKIANANTGASTINMNGLGAKSILTSKGAALPSGKLVVGGVYTLRYNGSAFILQGEGGEYGTASAGDVRSTKTIGTDSGLVNGSLVTQAAGAQTVTPGTADIVKAAGIYDGAITIKGDTNLLAANILSGKSIFGVAGSVIPGGQPMSSGTAVTAGSKTNVQYVSSISATTWSSALVTVSGLSLPSIPKIIVLRRKAEAFTSGVYSMVTIYRADGMFDFSTSGFDSNIVALSVSSSWTSMTGRSAFLTGALFANTGGFCLPAPTEASLNQQFEWYVW